MHQSATRAAITSMVMVAGMLVAAAPIHAQEIEPPDQLPAREESWVAPPPTLPLLVADAMAPSTTPASSPIPTEVETPTITVVVMPAPALPSPGDAVGSDNPKQSASTVTAVTSPVAVGVDRAVASNPVAAAPQSVVEGRRMKVNKVIVEVIAAIRRVLDGAWR
jgi:hypothetical protein